MNTSAAPKNRPTRRYLALISVGGLMTASLVAGGSLAATAADDTGSTTGNVEVSTAIVLSALTTDFTLAGLPGATVEDAGAVTFNVETNNLAGYQVSVTPATPTLVAATAGNADAIPIGNLSVTNADDDLTPFAATPTAVVVHTQAARSIEGGDELTNGYSVDIPFVNTDTYSVTLNYIASTL